MYLIMDKKKNHNIHTCVQVFHRAWLLTTMATTVFGKKKKTAFLKSESK